MSALSTTEASGPSPEPLVDAALAPRFIHAWKRIEAYLVRRGMTDPPNRDMAEALRRAERARLITAEIEIFLQSCRQARNAYSHVTFPGYSGPVAVPPRPVVHRLERLANGLANPGRARKVAMKAELCAPTTPASEALSRMHAHDFSQLPYWKEDEGWLLFTRRHIALFVQRELDEDGISLIDMSLSVHQIAIKVGATVPPILDHTASTSDAVRALEGSLTTPDELPGGYPAVLLVQSGEEAAPLRILTADDLPALHSLLGRCSGDSWPTTT